MFQRIIMVTIDGRAFRMSRDGLEEWLVTDGHGRFEAVDTDEHDNDADAAFEALERLELRVNR